MNKPGYIAKLWSGGNVHTAVEGCANIETGVEIDDRTRFYIASVSKQFTAFCVYLLESQGKLHTADKLAHYIEMPCAGDMTIAHMLNHTSGLREFAELQLLAGITHDDVNSYERMYALSTAQRGLDFAPGSFWSYSNTGYLLLSRIIERVSGQMLPDFLAANVFAPLDMDSTLLPKSYAGVIERRANGYLYVDGEYVNSPLTYSCMGSTGIVSTADDLLKWGRGFFDHPAALAPVYEKMLSPSSLSNGISLPYGGGLILGQYNGEFLAEHAGGEGGFRSHIMIIPSKQIVSAVLTNDRSMVVEAINRRHIANCIAGMNEDIVQRMPPIPAWRDGSYYLCAETGDLMFRREGEALVVELPQVLSFSQTCGAYTCNENPLIGAKLAGDNIMLQKGFDRTNAQTYVPLNACNVRAAQDEPLSCCGSYYSAELDTVFHIAHANNRLFLHYKGQTRVPLARIVPGVYRTVIEYRIGLPFPVELRFGDGGFELRFGAISGIMCKRFEVQV